MKLNELNSTQQKLLEKLDNTKVYVITRDLQANDSTSDGFAVACYGTEYRMVIWFITEHLDAVCNSDIEIKNNIIDNLLTAENKIKYLADLFGLTIVEGCEL